MCRQKIVREVLGHPVPDMEKIYKTLATVSSGGNFPNFDILFGNMFMGYNSSACKSTNKMLGYQIVKIPTTIYSGEIFIYFLHMCPVSRSAARISQACVAGSNNADDEHAKSAPRRGGRGGRHCAIVHMIHDIFPRSD